MRSFLYLNLLSKRLDFMLSVLNPDLGSFSFSDGAEKVSSFQWGLEGF